MKAKIYLNRDSIETWGYVRANDYYGRRGANTDKPGYWINSELLIAELPPAAVINEIPYMVSMPLDLRGPIYKNAPNLPNRFIESIDYWGKYPKQDISGRFYQPAKHAYMLNPELIEKYEYGTIFEDDKSFDPMISEGLVIHISFDPRELVELRDNEFVEIEVPIDSTQLKEGNIFDIMYPDTSEKIYLNVGDMKKAPEFYIDLIRYELIDYGYYY